MSKTMLFLKKAPKDESSSYFIFSITIKSVIQFITHGFKHNKIVTFRHSKNNFKQQQI